MRKAYIIMAHKSPNQVHRLISRLNDGNSEFFLHIDLKADISEFERVNEFGPAIIKWITRFDAKWGGLGLIKPFLAGLKAVRNNNTSFDRIMLLSGQDYPIKSNKSIDDFFLYSPYSNFIDYFPIPNIEKWPGSDRGGLYRVDKYYFGSERHQLFLSKALNFMSILLPPFKRKIPNGMKPFTGQTWWNLDMYALNYLLDYVDKHPEYIAFHKNTFVADELFVQMIVGNCVDKKLLNSIEKTEKRFTIWATPQSAHPKILAVTDLDAIKASKDLFARKFDEKIDSQILDLIDNQILFSRSKD